jgi:hypothetical protein
MELRASRSVVKGEDAWQDVPGEHRANLRRIIVTQGDTEPASVEQQRHLGLTAPSQYDLRNLFQVNVEEGRHLWAMVYLLHKHFGRDGREEGEALLQRRSGQQDNPRILQAYNEETPDWLSFFMFTYFTDRDGKFQLCALAESSFDPLARTTKFMRKCFCPPRTPERCGNYKGHGTPLPLCAEVFFLAAAARGIGTDGACCCKSVHRVEPLSQGSGCARLRFG